MDNSSLLHRVDKVLDEYKVIFGSADQLNFSDTIEAAQTTLEKLAKQRESLKATHELREDARISTALTSARKLAVYDQFQAEVVRKRKQEASDMSEVDLLDDSLEPTLSNRTKSRLEILAEERDYKRRRQSYKGGKTASSKRSYSEVIRDVIETQSEMLRSMPALDKKTIEKENF